MGAGPPLAHSWGMGILFGLFTFIACIVINGIVSAIAARRAVRAATVPRHLRAMHAPNPPFGLFVDDGHA